MYLVGSLLFLVPLLVSGGLGIVWLALLLVQGLPLLSEKLADLAYAWLEMWFMLVELYRLTELDAGVVLADLVTLIVGEEHVSGKTTLGGVGVYGCQHGGE
jgi:hypothetical protein